MPFYGIYIPSKGTSSSSSSSSSSTASISDNINNSNSQNETTAVSTHNTKTTWVFREKIKALEVLKQHKEARLKEFSNEDDAVEYAQTGYQIITNRYNDVKTSTVAAEKAPFPGPSKQMLQEFRKIIESGDHDRVRAIIWENPRYLVSSGDTPTSLKEGCRYNAMHICALSKKPQIAELILKTVSNPEFAELLIGKKNDTKTSKELALNLLDYYLNMPEKGRSETPLHLASKVGCVEMVELLTSYPECKINRNKDGDYPKDIICFRATIGGGPETVQKIKTLLEERFYVPVLRSMDAAVPPQIGQPFSPSNPPNLNSDPLSPEVKIQALAGPMNKEQALKFCRRWKTPPRLGTSSNSSFCLANSPFVSPIKARLNRTSHGTPEKSTSRSLLTESPNPTRRFLFDTSLQEKYSQNDSTIDDLLGHPESAKHLNDPDDQPNVNSNDLNILKETNNNVNYENHNHQQKEKQEQSQEEPEEKEDEEQEDQEAKDTAIFPKTPLKIKHRSLFLQYREQMTDSPAPSLLVPPAAANLSIASEADFFDSPSYKERHIKLTNTEKGLEMIGRQLAKEQNVDWREYWDFLNDFIDITSPEGLQQLENYFAQKKREAEMKKKALNSSNRFSFHSADLFLNEVCNALEGFHLKGQEGKKNGFIDLQLDELMGVTSTSSSLSMASITTLQQSTTPYTCIEKSLQVFAKRITKTITTHMENVSSINDILLSELKRLKRLICSFKIDTRFHNVDFTKIHSRIANLVAYYLNRSHEVNGGAKLKIQQILENVANLSGERREHIECVCAKMIAFFEQTILEEDLPENMKNDEMCSTAWNEELSCQCCWDSDLSHKPSRRQRIENRLKQIKEAENQKRLMKNMKKEKRSASWSRDNSMSDSVDEDAQDVFWSDCDFSESEEDEYFYTPVQSPSRLSLLEIEEEEPYKQFIYGDEPTKRDLDVINAIFNVDIDETKYPCIHAWRTVMSKYSPESIDQFPSPTIAKKTYAFAMKTPKLAAANPKDHQMPHLKQQMPAPRTPHYYRQFMQTHNATSTPTDDNNLSIQNTKNQALHEDPNSKAQKPNSMPPPGSPKRATTTQPAPQPPPPSPQQPSEHFSFAKRLFSSPLRKTTAATASSLGLTAEPRLFSTPLNKVRGLFSAYRESNLNSPLSSSLLADRDSSDNSMNLSIANVSSIE